MIDTVTPSINDMTGLADLQACEKYCVFQRGRSVFAILATSVREVGLKPKVVQVPDSHPHLAGLAHVRNEFVPLLQDTELATGANDLHDAQIVILNHEHGAWGLLVDRVVGLLSLDVSLCGESQGTRGWGAAVMGSATWDHRVVQVLDERALYRSISDDFNQYWTR